VPRPKDDAGGARPVLAASGLGEAPWRRLLDRSRELRSAYADLASWHECTEHSP